MNAKDFILKNKIVSISRQVYGEGLLESANRLIAGGIKILEITFDQADPEGIKKTTDSVRLVKKELGDKICVGAGTVMTIEQAQRACDAGADFALAPNVDLNVIHEIKRLNMVAVPGALTASEIATAYNEGADIVKIFPVSILGGEYLKAITGPINHIPFMAVGGVTPENIKCFFDLGCCSAGIGSNIINKKRVEQGLYDDIQKTAETFVKAVQLGQ